MFKKKETINTIIERYKTDPIGAVKYIDQLRELKEYRYEDKRLSDLKTIIEMAIIVGARADNK